MSGEIDFSFLIAALRRRWWIILLCVAIALAAAVAIGMFQGRRYEASNVLLVQSPRYQWRFAGEITAITDQRRDFQREVLAIARSDEIAQAATAALALPDGQEGLGPQAVKDAVDVRAGDGNTIIVTATSGDPSQAAAYARAWTQTLIDSARDIYGALQDLDSFEAELQELEARMLEAEDALAEVRARTGVISNNSVPDEVMRASLTMQQLNKLTETLAEYQLAIQSLDYLRRSIAEAAPDADLQQLPWELLAGPVLSERGLVSVEIARANLGDPVRLASLLQEEQSAVQATANELTSQTDQLRTTLAADWEEFSIVGRELNQARDLYQIVLRKVNELRLQEQLDPSLLSIVGSPDPTVTHVRAPLFALLATAAIAGLIVGVLLAVLTERSSRKKAEASPAATV
jgi:uncharacterized protein involved in exopolysaccharide biosynthesis